MMTEDSYLKKGIFILSKIFFIFFLCSLYPARELNADNSVFLGVKVSIISSLLPDVSGDDAYNIAKRLKADLSHGYPGPNLMPGIQFTQGYAFRNGFSVDLTEEYFVTEVDARFSGEYLLDPDFYYRRNFFHLILSTNYRKSYSSVSIYANAGAGVSYIITHTKGYFNDSYYRVGRPLLSAKIGSILPDKEFIGMDIGIRYNYVFNIPSTNFFYNDGGNASLLSFEVGLQFSI